ncbi:hypothetical protein Pmani_013104 [Petrolisthes manimaculis]|uniref:Transferrin-like domain-containing protein n=1 Tax=Petrolisthes manimaculis TaxID=1843537 RepID=A0AAE1PVR0_9EUCA|nr:hypothetical protein Pmani_013104 [Petrolisthes manimaculis]
MSHYTTQVSELRDIERGSRSCRALHTTVCITSIIMERVRGMGVTCWWWMLVVTFLMTINIQVVHLTPFTLMPPAGRLCVEEGVTCSDLSEVSGNSLSCTPVRDRLDCLKKIRDDEADFGYFEAEDLKITANAAFSDEYEAAVQVSNDEEVQRVYILIHNASNPEPSSMCHPGLSPYRYFPTVLHRLITTPHHGTPNIKSHIQHLNQTWSSACIPGSWSMDPATDRQLKQQYPHLCHTCQRQSCHTDDPYAGSGTLQCLMDHAADAAFVSDVDLKKFRAENPDIEDLWHYCDNKSGPNTIEPLSPRGSQEEEPCNWGRRPLPVIMFAPCNNTDCQTLRTIWIRALTTHSQNVVNVLKLANNTKITAMEHPETPSSIMIQVGYKMHETNSKKPVKFCVHSREELDKCEDLVLAAEGYEAHSGLGLGCHFSNITSDCYPSIYFQKADVVTLDGGDVHQVTRNFGFQRLLSEVYNTQSGTPTSSYYAVAVVRATSNITSFSHLRGRTSCHTGIGKTAGWKLPVATLQKLRLIDPQHCNFVDAMAEFFSGGSCAPGAKLPKYNQQSHYIERLCQLCVGEDYKKCARNSDEPFYSYTGAFRCLVQGGGDVAFVKHTTVPDNTDGANTDSWAVGLRSEEFRLLCSSNSGSSTAAINEYRTCNLALVPAHEVVVASEMPEVRKKQVRQALLMATETFKEGAPGSKTFKLFGKYKGRSDLLFKDSAKGLRALTEDTTQERKRKETYFTKLDELHSCEVRVCALEEQMEQCEAMVETMSAEGHQFVCVSARDRLDCVQRVGKGQVDMTPLPGGYLQSNPNLRIIAYSRDPVYSLEQYRYRAVMVVRRSTVKQMSDLRGKKSCHTGYGRTTGWRIPVAMLKRMRVIQPLCNPNQSSLEHEIISVATTFNRACIPGEWATVPQVDAALKGKYKAMCSMCQSRTCDVNDNYAGYEGALRCLTQNGGDVAFSKLSITQDFFSDTRLNASEFGLLCQDGSIVDITSSAAKNCYWAARPWNTFVTRGGASDAKVQKLQWALTQAKRKGEENLVQNQWYFNTLGIDDSFSDLFPAMDDLNLTSGEYYAQTGMDVVEAERMCSSERDVPVKFCVTSDEEARKCNDLSSMLKLRGVSPDLVCVKGNDVSQCLTFITLKNADMMVLSDSQRFNSYINHKLSDLLSETYATSELNRYYLVGVVKQNSSIHSFRDLHGKTTCNAAPSSNGSDIIDSNLSNCLSGTSDFFHTYRDAFICLLGSNKDIAFVKHDINNDGGLDTLTSGYLNPANFNLVCEESTLPTRSYNVRECNFGRVRASMVVTRGTESGARKENMRHVLLKASQYFGKRHSFFRLFYDYYSHSNLLFSDDTTKLTPLEENTHAQFALEMIDKACNLYVGVQLSGA